jgi:hypothetical protein
MTHSPQGHDAHGLWEGVEDLVVKTLLAVQPSLAAGYFGCFRDENEGPGNDGFSCFEVLVRVCYSVVRESLTCLLLLRGARLRRDGIDGSAQRRAPALAHRGEPLALLLRTLTAL